jgi:hypothetical protein
VAVDVALLPPLCDARLVPLPPLRPAEAEAVIRRDAARYFVGGSSARTVAVLPSRERRIRRRASGEGAAPVFAAAAPIALVEAVRNASKAMGWTPRRIVPGHGAWLAALDAVAPAAKVPARVVIALDGEAAHVLRADAGAVLDVRRVPAAWAEEVVSAAGPPPGAALLLADGAAADAVARSLTAAGWDVRRGSADAALTAASHAYDSPFELSSPTALLERGDRARASARWIAGAAMLLIIAAAAVELWGANRELDSIRARRAAIRAEVGPLLATRDSAASLDQTAIAIATLDRQAPRWTRALFDLALLLPSDTHVNSLRTMADTLLVDASGMRAASSIESLRDAGSLKDVRLVGPIERDLQGGATTAERFRLRATLVPPLPGTSKATTVRGVASGAVESPARRMP